MDTNRIAAYILPMLSDQLKKAIVDSGKTLIEIAEATGVTHPVLSRFLSTDPESHRDIRLEKTGDKLASYFGLTLQPDDGSAAKAKVKAPALPAVDWAAAKPAKKRKAEPPPGPTSRGKRK